MTPCFAEIFVEGTDARSFLQSQLASDVAALASGSWQYSSYCGADGRVQALLLLACVDTEHYALLLPGELAKAVLARLQRYRLRARCTLALRAVAIAAGAHPQARRLRGSGIEWEVRTSETPVPLPQPLWDQQLAFGVPWLEARTSERWLPQMLALERLGAFSLRKGCYPGQEIIARTHYLGRSKRRLARVRVLAGAPAAGDALLDAAGAECGALVALDGHGNGLAVLAEAVSEGARARVGDAHAISTLVIESDVLGTIGDMALNRCFDPPSSA